jgi:hypothetical protein
MLWGPRRPVEDPPSIRSINQPHPLSVEADDRGLPLAVMRLEPRRVAAIQDVWRIDDEWWRELISRRYFQVVLDGGEIRTIYHDLVSDEWFEQWY